MLKLGTLYVHKVYIMLLFNKYMLKWVLDTRDKSLKNNKKTDIVEGKG